MKQGRSYVATSLLSSSVLFYAWRLNESGRGLFDWTIMGLALIAVLWNLVNLGLRLCLSDGGRSLWHLLRTLLFWVIGILDTGFVRPVDVGSWQYVFGWMLVVAAVFDTYQLHRKERAANAADFRCQAQQS